LAREYHINVALHLVQHAETLPSTQQEQIASLIVSQKAVSVCSSGHQANLELSLATKGRKTTICLNPQIKKPVEFTTENMLQLCFVLIWATGHFAF